MANYRTYRDMYFNETTREILILRTHFILYISNATATFGFVDGFQIHEPSFFAVLLKLQCLTGFPSNQRDTQVDTFYVWSRYRKRFGFRSLNPPTVLYFFPRLCLEELPGSGGIFMSFYRKKNTHFCVRRHGEYCQKYSENMTLRENKNVTYIPA